MTLPPRPERLVSEIRRLVRLERVAYTRHALEDRMPERGIDVSDVEYVLMNGRVLGPVRPGKRAGEWHAKLVARLDGTSRNAGVVTVVLIGERVLILTAEWEDL